MSEAIELGAGNPAAAAAAPPGRKSLLGRFAAQYADGAVPFEVVMPDGSAQLFGRGAPTFRVTLKNRNAVRAISSIDEGRIAAAYLAGDIDLDGDMLKPFALRATMKDFHLLTEAWHFIQPLLFGQVRTNRQAIASHYDIDTLIRYTNQVTVNRYASLVARS